MTRRVFHVPSRHISNRNGHRAISFSVNHFAVDCLVEPVEMRDLERPYRLYRDRDNLLGVAGRLCCTHLVAHGAKRPQHLRAIESLSLTMVTKGHGLLNL